MQLEKPVHSTKILKNICRLCLVGILRWPAEVYYGFIWVVEKRFVDKGCDATDNAQRDKAGTKKIPVSILK